MIFAFFKAIWEAGGKWWFLLILGGTPFLVTTYNTWRIDYPADLPFLNFAIPLPAAEPWWVYAGAVIALWTTARLAWLEAKRQLAQPHLSLRNPRVEIIPVHCRDEEGVVETVFPHVARVDLHNAPEHRTTAARLEGAHTTLEFFDAESGHLVYTLPFARWTDNTQPGYRDSPSSVDFLRYRDVQPNDGANKVDIVLKYKDEPDAYAFNAESGWLVLGQKDERWRVPGRRWFVHVTVKSSNAPDHRECFVLEHRGVDSTLSLRRNGHV
jgi:hypothetical protein